MRLQTTTADEPTLVVLAYNLSATGVTLNAIRIAAHAMECGITTELWLWQNSGPFRDRMPPQLNIVEFGASSRRYEFGFLRRFGIISRVVALSKLISSRKPKILLSAGNRSHLAAGIAYRIAGSPSVTTLVARASNAKPSLNQTGFIATLWNSIDTAKFVGFHRIIAVSKELAQKLVEIRPRLSGKISVIPNGVDLHKFSPVARDVPKHPFFPKKGPLIVSAGTITAQKNFPLLVDAIAELRHELPEARLIIMGNGSDTERKRLLDRIRRLRLQDHVSLAGYVHDPVSYYVNADVYVLSSLWEGASNSLLEALACGMRVVATDCPTGIREALNDGQEGAIVAVGDPRALAEAIAAELRKPLSLTRADWMNQYDLSRCLTSYIEFFNGIRNPESDEGDAP